MAQLSPGKYVRSNSLIGAQNIQSQDAAIYLSWQHFPPPPRLSKTYQVTKFKFQHPHFHHLEKPNHASANISFGSPRQHDLHKPH